jgi:hypothetical protein
MNSSVKFNPLLHFSFQVPIKTREKSYLQCLRANPVLPAPSHFLGGTDQIKAPSQKLWLDRLKMTG